MNKQSLILLFLILLTIFSWTAYIICVYADVNHIYISTLKITSQISLLLIVLTLAYFRYKSRK